MSKLFTAYIEKPNGDHIVVVFNDGKVVRQGYADAAMEQFVNGAALFCKSFEEVNFTIDNCGFYNADHDAADEALAEQWLVNRPVVWQVGTHVRIIAENPNRKPSDPYMVGLRGRVIHSLSDSLCNIVLDGTIEDWPWWSHDDGLVSIRYDQLKLAN